MNAKKISALLLAAAMMAPCAAPVQVLAAEEAAQEASQETEAKDTKIYFSVYWRWNELSSDPDYKLLSECHRG